MSESNRPEWIKCIDTDPSQRGALDMRHTFCGHRAQGLFLFVDLDHALDSRARGDRLQPCGQCLEAALFERDGEAGAKPDSPLQEWLLESENRRALFRKTISGEDVGCRLELEHDTHVELIGWGRGATVEDAFQEAAYGEGTYSRPNLSMVRAEWEELGDRPQRQNGLRSYPPDP